MINKVWLLSTFVIKIDTQKKHSEKKPQGKTLEWTIVPTLLIKRLNLLVFKKQKKKQTSIIC